MEKNYDIPFLESYRGFFDYFKHITTLNTGAILIIVAFIERAFKNPEGKSLVVLAFICFVLSLIGSVSTMYQYAIKILKEETKSIKKEKKFKRFLISLNFLLSKYGFIIGMLLLALFGVINIISGSPSGYTGR